MQPAAGIGAAGRCREAWFPPHLPLAGDMSCGFGRVAVWSSPFFFSAVRFRLVLIQSVTRCWEWNENMILKLAMRHIRNWWQMTHKDVIACTCMYQYTHIQTEDSYSRAITWHIQASSPEALVRSPWHPQVTWRCSDSMADVFFGIDQEVTLPFCVLNDLEWPVSFGIRKQSDRMRVTHGGVSSTTICPPEGVSFDFETTIMTMVQQLLSMG